MRNLWISVTLVLLFAAKLCAASPARPPQLVAAPKDVSLEKSKLSVEGHTDNIGGDAYNMDLSNRRASAVKQTLVYRYGINESRLVTAGFGATKPKESNETLEGRARNRRVELVRQ